MALKTSERRRLPGLEEQRRAELLPAGSTLLVTILELFDLDGLITSDWALREGIVLDAVRSHDPSDWSDDPRALRRASVTGLARRCNSDVAHTAQVARLAKLLFDQTEELHGLDDRDREMLEFAALLHDIGQHVSRKGHHRHAAYLVENGELRGFDPSEVAFLAAPGAPSPARRPEILREPVQRARPRGPPPPAKTRLPAAGGGRPGPGSPGRGG